MVIERNIAPSYLAPWRFQDAIDQIVRGTYHFVPPADYERSFAFCVPPYTRVG